MIPNTPVSQVIMLLKHALQMVLTVSKVVSAPRSGTLRLGSLRGPTTTAWPLIPWGFEGSHRACDGRRTPPNKVTQRRNTGATGHDEGNEILMRSLNSCTRAPSFSMRNWIVSIVAQAHGAVLHTSRRRVSSSI
jgi:hypothetical protein